MIFIISIPVTSLDLGYSKLAISENIGISGHPIVGGRDNSLLSTSEHLMPPVIDSVDYFVITPSILFNRFAIFSIILFLISFLHALSNFTY